MSFFKLCFFLVTVSLASCAVGVTKVPVGGRAFVESLVEDVRSSLLPNAKVARCKKGDEFMVSNSAIKNFLDGNYRVLDFSSDSILGRADAILSAENSRFSLDVWFDKKGKCYKYNMYYISE